MTTWLAVQIVNGLRFVNRAHAQVYSGSGDVEIENPLGCDSFGCVVGKIIDGLIEVAIPLVTIVVLVGGFQMLTAGGDPEKFTRGRKTLLYAAVGFVVIILAKSFVLILSNLFG